MTGDGERIATLEAQVETLTKQVDDLNADRKRMMRWGIMALGAAVVGLGGYVWSLAVPPP